MFLEEFSSLKALLQLRDHGLLLETSIFTFIMKMTESPVITRVGEEPVRNVRVSDPVISDHSSVHFKTLCQIKPSFEGGKING